MVKITERQTQVWMATLFSLACIFALGVLMLGAYTRLTHAGLGCPDWPGCYGHWVVEAGTVDSTKAWTEMIHRYAAGTLGLIIFSFTALSFVKSSWRRIRSPLLLLTGLVIFQAALGMWTVTLKLHPTVVMGHLLGGMTIFGLLVFTTVRYFAIGRKPTEYLSKGFMYCLVAAVIVVFCQIFLGGWTSANYSALVCLDFPSCQGSSSPEFQWMEAFNLFRPVGQNYDGGVLSHSARVTIHMTHRMGALITFLTVAGVGLSAMRFSELRMGAWVILTLLMLQIALGLLNIQWMLPLPVAVLHNGVAALLFGSLLGLLAYAQRLRQVQETETQ